MDPIVYTQGVALLATFIPASIAVYLPLLPLLWLVLVFLKPFIPAPKAGSKWLPFYNAFNLAAGNFLHASNAIPAGLPTNPSTPVAIMADIVASAPAQVAAANVAEGLVSDLQKAVAAKVAAAPVVPTVPVPLVSTVIPAVVAQAPTFIPAAVAAVAAEVEKVPPVVQPVA